MNKNKEHNEDSDLNHRDTNIHQIQDHPNTRLTQLALPGNCQQDAFITQPQ